MALCRRRVDEERKVHRLMHVGIDSGNVLDESIARAGEVSEARFQTREEFGEGQSVLV
jgi:hypothetical protein